MKILAPYDTTIDSERHGMGHMSLARIAHSLSYAHAHIHRTGLAGWLARPGIRGIIQNAKIQNHTNKQMTKKNENLRWRSRWRRLARMKNEEWKTSSRFLFVLFSLFLLLRGPLLLVRRRLFALSRRSRTSKSRNIAPVLFFQRASLHASIHCIPASWDSRILYFRLLRHNSPRRDILGSRSLIFSTRDIWNCFCPSLSFSGCY